jgi:5-methylcytosine-specific restriction enzyme A
VFVKGKNYVRRELHDQFGGQQQGGISTPSQHPIILIFTGEQGAEYGYRDGWTEEGVFCYTGEGQQGDMEFKRGNSAIRDHIQSGKDLYLFQYVNSGIVRYVDQMVCSGYEYREAPDIDGNSRQAIVSI